MFTLEEIEILQTDSVRETILRLRTQDPAQVALSLGEHRALIATQIKYLQRAKTKLPDYYQAGCILPPLSFEQCSSTESAATKHYGGELCLDLTCGLGVDALHFSKTFKRVVAVERDPILAQIARINFSRLGASNIEVIETSAEEFLESLTRERLTKEHPDLIYIDPDRRDNEGRKVFLLEHCSPNVIALLPTLRGLAKRLVVKTSPLFDVQEAFRIFGPEAAVEVVSWRGECKEVIVEIPATLPSTGGVLRTTIAGGESLTFDQQAETESVAETRTGAFAPPYHYLLIPDVSLYKARRVRQYAARMGVVAPTETGYCYANTPPADFFGRCFAIQAWELYHPKTLKTQLKSQGIKRATLFKRDFTDEPATVARSLGIAQGGNHLIALTQIGQNRYALTLKPMP